MEAHDHEVGAAFEGIAGVLERRRLDIERRWLEQITADVTTAGVDLTDLRNGMPRYAKELARALASDDGARAEEEGNATFLMVAREHGLTRVRLGFDVGQLVHEFIVLRRIIQDVLAEEGLERDESVDRVSAFIDAAISAAVKSYVDSRDFAARREEARHIGFITHELRNPLTTATVALSQLRHLLPEPPAGQRRLFELLSRALESLKDLIDKVLLTERLEAGEVESQPIEIELGELLGPILRDAQARAEDKGLRLVTDFDPRVRLRLDPELTTSALQNLVDNALKYTDEGTVSIRVVDGQDEVIFHVHDNCEGLSAEELRTIFAPFRRGATRKHGSGLGLAIAKRSVEAQEGTIGAESDHEGGCHFWISLPKAKH
jgi:signal transduction histidine kinase